MTAAKPTDAEILKGLEYWATRYDGSDAGPALWLAAARLKELIVERIAGDPGDRSHGPRCSCHICFKSRRAEAEGRTEWKDDAMPVPNNPETLAQFAAIKLQDAVAESELREALKEIIKEYRTHGPAGIDVMYQIAADALATPPPAPPHPAVNEHHMISTPRPAALGTEEGEEHVTAHR